MVYEFPFSIINGMFVNINNMLYGLVSPISTYGVSGLPQALVFFFKRHAFFESDIYKYLSAFYIFSYLGKHQKAAERNSTQKTCRISSWSPIQTRLVTKTMSNNCQYIVYIWHIWYCTYIRDKVDIRCKYIYIYIYIYIYMQ